MNRVSTCSGGAGPTTFSTPAPFSLFTCATKGGWGYARVHQAGWAVEWKLLMTRELREIECQIWRRRKVVIGWMSMISIRRARNQKQPVAFATSCRSIVLRRERDSNSRYPFGVHTLSRRASSATRASLQYVSGAFRSKPDCKGNHFFRKCKYRRGNFSTQGYKVRLWSMQPGYSSG